jgi:aminopeptidase N
LANRALSLALTDEAAVTTRPGIVRNVGGEFPELAFDFVSAHLAQVNSWLETDSRNQFTPGIASNSNDKKMIARLTAFAAAHIPATANSAVVKAVSAIAFSAEVRTKRLPDVDRWLAANAAK